MTNPFFCDSKISAGLSVIPTLAHLPTCYPSSPNYKLLKPAIVKLQKPKP